MSSIASGKVNADYLSQAQNLQYGQIVKNVSLKGLSITRPNQVWATVTYIRLSSGYVYLVAVMDWFSRDGRNSLDVFFCLSALERALRSSPLYLTTTKEVSLLPRRLLVLKPLTLRGSASGFGVVKYEEVYLNDYDSMNTAHRRRDYFIFYNREHNRSTIEHHARCISNNFRR